MTAGDREKQHQQVKSSGSRRLCLLLLVRVFFHFTHYLPGVEEKFD